VLLVPHAEPLPCGFVHVADGQPAVAAALARTVQSRADNLGQPCAHVRGLELLAASIATDNPRARELFASADEERSEIGAHAWRHITRVPEGQRAA
jgi:hypothetical protein